MTAVTLDPHAETRPPNKRALARAATRAKVLKAAGFMFANAGFFSTGIRDIAERVGMSTGAVFANFESKEDLWREAMGCPAPDRKLAEEAALTVAAYPDRPFWIYADGDRCKASIGNPVRALAVPGEGGWHGTGDTPAEALRQARIEADRKQGAPLYPWMTEAERASALAAGEKRA